VSLSERGVCFSGMKPCFSHAKCQTQRLHSTMTISTVQISRSWRGKPLTWLHKLTKLVGQINILVQLVHGFKVFRTFGHGLGDVNEQDETNASRICVLVSINTQYFIILQMIIYVYNPRSQISSHSNERIFCMMVNPSISVENVRE